MIQSVWKNLTGLQKTAEHLWCDFITHHQTPMTCTYGFSHFIHFKTGETEVQIQFKHMNYVSIFVASLKVHFSLLKKGVTQSFFAI